MSFLYLDLETAHTNDPKIIENIIESIKPPGNITKDETRLKWLETNLIEETAKAIRKTALDGLYGQIISIAWAIDDNKISCLCRESYEQSEKSLIESFFYLLENSFDKNGQRIGISKWVGHNILGFDLRFLWQRCVINKVKPTINIPIDAKPWDDRVFDTCTAWKGFGNMANGAGDLDSISSVLLGKGKDEITGANVYDYWMAGKIEEIEEYNKADVDKTRRLHKLMTFGY